MRVIFEDVVVPDVGSLDLSVPATPEIRISAVRARQLVGIYMGNYVGLFLHGQTLDELVVREDRVYWRVPVILSRGRQGRIGIVGAVDVDADTGELMLDDLLIAEIKENARNLTTRQALEPVG
ncbi:MAG: hypothetical protein HY328_14230 [Chloroflexi bacterium]|nr:hypothetical protein [Chloroflexota bacterium]